MNKKILLIMDAVVVAALIFLDQLTKKLAVTHLKNQPAHVLINGVLELDYLENRGVAFGMLQGQRFVILAVGIVFLAVLGAFMIKMPAGRKYTWMHVILSFVIAGGIGNMIDRFRLEYVIDFISFVLVDYPIFNVADCYVVCGVIAMCIMLLFVFRDEDLEFLSPKRAKEK